MAIQPEREGPAAGQEGLLQRLKAETHAQHRRVEQAVPLMQPGFQASDYRSYLLRLLGYYRPLERQLTRLRGELALAELNLAERTRTPLLEQDLATLGLDDAAIASAAACPALPGTATLAEAWGVLYVLEGSTLGGQILSRHLRASLGLALFSETHFLNPYGERTGAMWKQFTGALSRWGGERGPQEQAQVVASAQQTFGALTAWLELNGVS